MQLIRRDFLRSLAAVSCAKPNFAASDSRQEQEPHLQFPANARDRLSVTSYPFRAFIDSPTNHGRQAGLTPMDLKDFAAFVADKFNIHNINPLSDHFRSTDRVYLDTLVTSVANAHSHIVDLGLPGRQFYSHDESVRQAAVKFGCDWIEKASAIGSPSVRQHVAGTKGEPSNVELAAQSLGKLAEYGGKRNVVVNLENDSPVAEDPFFLISVIEKVNSPYLRGLPDFGNSLLAHDAEYNRRAVSGMLQHAFNMCHVKDVVETEEGQRRTVDLGQMFRLAKASGYRGYFSMEFETKLGDPITGTRKLASETLRYLA